MMGIAALNHPTVPWNQRVHPMSHVSYTELRANLAKYMDEVCDSRDALHVTRQNARTVVMLSEEEYEGMLETLHLVRNPTNAARLLRSIESADTGTLTEHEIIDARPDAK
jgi:antitoxin YefM